MSEFKPSLETAVELCRLIEEFAPKYGCHVALTGGCLYKDGERKDFDFLFYRIRQVDEIDQDGLFEEMREIGFNTVGGYGWLFKTSYKGFPVDLFFPEEQGEGEYGEDG